MNRVVERCPSCGVEHDEPTHECEACGSPVRYWCRTHSREFGWLESDVCPRCPPGAARPRPPKAAPAPPSAAAPAPNAGAAPASASRPYLRFEPRPTTPPASPAAPTPPAVPAAPAPAAAAAPPAPEKARRNRRGMGVRLFEALLTVLQTGIVGVLVGVAGGGIAAYRIGAEVPLEAAIGGAKGGMAGLAVGVLIAAAFFHRSAYPRED